MADIVYTTVTLPPAFIGVPYEAAVAYKSAATVVTAQSVNTGTLPTGLALDTVGASPGSLRITGTPTALGTFTFTVSATDTAGAVVSPSYTIQVFGAEGDEKMTGQFHTPTAANAKRKLN